MLSDDVADDSDSDTATDLSENDSADFIFLDGPAVFRDPPPTPNSPAAISTEILSNASTEGKSSPKSVQFKGLVEVFSTHNGQDYIRSCYAPDLQDNADVQGGVECKPAKKCSTQNFVAGGWAGLEMTNDHAQNVTQLNTTRR